MSDSEKSSICRGFIEHTLKYNQTARKLVDSIEELGCEIPSDFFVCRPCGAEMGITGGFAVPSPGQTYKPQIVVCDDKHLSKKLVTNTLVHELVHAYDFCKSKINASSCVQRACTEIRASALSDECNLSAEIMRGNVHLNNGHSLCVKRRARLSLECDPVCKEGAERYVTSVFGECYRDKSPLE